MSYLLGKLNLRAFRYCVLGERRSTPQFPSLNEQKLTYLLSPVTFLVCNALIASLAVWNLGLVRGFESVSVDRCMLPLPFSPSFIWLITGTPFSPFAASLLGLDSYLTFLGCSGLALFFVV